MMLPEQRRTVMVPTPSEYVVFKVVITDERDSRRPMPTWEVDVRVVIEGKECFAWNSNAYPDGVPADLDMVNEADLWAIAHIPQVVHDVHQIMMSAIDDVAKALRRNQLGPWLSDNETTRFSDLVSITQALQSWYPVYGQVFIDPSEWVDGDVAIDRNMYGAIWSKSNHQPVRRPGTRVEIQPRGDKQDL